MTINELSEQIARCLLQMTNQSNLQIIRTVSDKVKAKLQTHQKPEKMVDEYSKFLELWMRDAGLIDANAFCRRAIQRAESLESEPLKSAIKVTLEYLMHVNGERYEKERIAHRETVTVRALTFSAYALFIELLSVFVPGTRSQVPGHVYTLLITAAIGNTLTTGYRNFHEFEQSIPRIGDQVVSNISLSHAFGTLDNFAQRSVLALSDRLNQIMGTSPSQVNGNTQLRLTGALPDPNANNRLR